MKRLVSFGLVFSTFLVGGIPSAHAQYFAFGKNRVQYEEQEWRMIQTSHVDVYYYERETGGGLTLATFAAEAAEAAYGQTARVFGKETRARVPLIVYPSHSTFGSTNVVDLGDYPERVGGVTELFKNRIVVPFTGDWRAFREVIRHEMVHVFVNDAFYGGSLQAVLRRGIQSRVPAWFNEGLAEYAALGWNTTSDMYLREAVIEGELAPIPRLSGFFAYRGGQGVWDYVAQQYGREKVAEIVERARRSGSVGGAFLRSTGLTLSELSDRWHETLRAVYYPEAAAREGFRNIGRPLATGRIDEAVYRAAPALSPQGDRIAYIAARNGLLDVLVGPTEGEEKPRVLIQGQESSDFESLQPRTPGLAWSPDGRQIAIAVTSQGNAEVALIDVQTGETRHIRARGVDAINSIAWGVYETKLALSASAGAHSDLFLLDTETERITNLTRDLWSDHAPVWGEDGTRLFFHSDRGEEVELGVFTSSDTHPRDLRSLGGSSFDIYEIPVDSAGPLPAKAVRWTEDSADNTRPHEVGGRLLFVSDRNGIPNLVTVDSLGTRALTDVQSGVMDVSLSRNGDRAAILALEKGTPSIFLLRNPLRRSGDVPADPAPTVWAQRASGGEKTNAPAVSVASASNLEGNPFLRDATDGRPPEPLVAGPVDVDPAVLDSLLAASDLSFSRDRPPDSILVVDPRSHTSLPAVEDSTRGLLDDSASLFHPDNNRKADGGYRERRYRLRFTPDIVTATGGYDTVYGIQSIVRMQFSDVLGDHRISIASNLVLDLRNADYQLTYENRGGRTDWWIQGYHLARELSDPNSSSVFRYRNFGMTMGAGYPFSKFRRVDFELGVVGVSLADLGNLAQEPRTRAFVVPRATYTADFTTPGTFGTAGGTRYAASLSGTPGPRVQFATLLVDGRHYIPLGLPGYTLAIRGSGGISLGPDPQRFYAAGVQNWFNPDIRSLPVEGPDDFVFATPVLPLRGLGFNEADGDRFMLVNAEIRMPLIAALLPGPLPITPLYNLQAVVFGDAGFISQGGIDLWRDEEVDADGDGEPDWSRRVFDDPLVGVGVGLRTVAFGFPLRVDWGWPFDGINLRPGHVYFSVGLDF